MALKMCDEKSTSFGHRQKVTEDFIRALVKDGPREPWKEKYLDRAELMRRLGKGYLRAWHTDGGQVYVEDPAATEENPTVFCAAEYCEEIHAFPLYGTVILCGWAVIDGAGTLWHLPRAGSENEEDAADVWERPDETE